MCLTSLWDQGLSIKAGEPINIGEHGINVLEKERALFKERSHFKFLLTVLNVLGDTLVSCGRQVDSQRPF